MKILKICCAATLLLALPATADEETDRATCESLIGTRNLTITEATMMSATARAPTYCYVKGIISPAIGYHVQLPLPGSWNGKFLQWGDGGKDGDLDFADHRLAEGYAVANSNLGHDNGSEPGASFGFNNRQAEIDFGYRAVHLTVNAAKTLVRAYYDAAPTYSYFEGCSTGGRQGLMEAQRYPFDFDGIIAGAPVNYYQELNAGHIWLLQRVFENDFAGNLAHDTDGDGRFDSLGKLDMLADTVMSLCDANDGIADGVIDDPLSCKFEPERDLAEMMCRAGQDTDTCLTEAEMRTIKDFYSGPYDSRGMSIIKGRALGAERGWTQYLPHEGNGNLPPMLRGAANGHVEYLFYENDPGVPVHDLADLSRQPDRNRQPPEYAWWEFDIDDVTAGRSDFMKTITNAIDPDLSRFLIEQNGKLILWHGWADPIGPPEPTLDYYNEVVAETFDGQLNRAREHARLFMFPGMAHCGGGPGPNQWDALAPLVEWVENGIAPDAVTATHTTGNVVDNERRVCAYPEQAAYSGPSGEQDEPANWVAGNFVCR